MNRSELQTVVRQEIKGLSTEFNTDDYKNAIDAAERDTGWASSYSGNFKEQWILQRTKRHLYSYLLTESAHKFQYKQIRLGDRFKHYKQLVDGMDKEFVAAQAENSHEFAGVAAKYLFGSKIDAGFATDGAGRDYTYDKDQRVIVKPDDSS